MKLIVGLGNPGDEYKKTRHNVGFMSIDNYLGDVKFKEKYNGLYYEKSVNGEKIIFLKPLTYMNNSGECVRKYVDFFDIEHSNIMVIQDDLDLPTGTIRFKIKSTSGGHNGIKSIINHLNGDDFFRLKVGISNTTNDVIDYVIGNFSKKELNLIDFNLINAAIDDFILNDCEYVMNKYNRK